MNLIELCNTDDIQNSQSKEFSLTRIEPPLEIFVIRQNNQFYAYVNRCPHTGINLNWQKDQFFDIDHHYIQCALHGALFNVADGYCVRGPCAGDYLQPVKTISRNNVLYYQPDA